MATGLTVTAPGRTKESSTEVGNNSSGDRCVRAISNSHGDLLRLILVDSAGVVSVEEPVAAAVSAEVDGKCNDLAIIGFLITRYTLNFAARCRGIGCGSNEDLINRIAEIGIFANLE